MLPAPVDTNYGSWAALHYAASNGHPALVPELLRRGADTEARTEHDDYTPLYLTTRSNHPDCARALLRGGAQVDAFRETDGLTVIMDRSFTNPHSNPEYACKIDSGIAN